MLEPRHRHQLDITLVRSHRSAQYDAMSNPLVWMLVAALLLLIYLARV